MEEHSIKKQYVCDCGETFTDISEAEEHEFNHTNELIKHLNSEKEITINNINRRYNYVDLTYESERPRKIYLGNIPVNTVEYGEDVEYIDGNWRIWWNSE